MSVHLESVIAATTRWLVTAYPPPPGALPAALAEGQARQAVTVAAWLRYPTDMDAGLVHLVGPGGAHRLDWLVGAVDMAGHTADEAWRTWVDEVVASWAACLLGDPPLAAAAVNALASTHHTAGLVWEFNRLLAPDLRERRAAALLRQPELLAAVADIHRQQLMDRLLIDTAGVDAA